MFQKMHIVLFPSTNSTSCSVMQPNATLTAQEQQVTAGTSLTPHYSRLLLCTVSYTVQVLLSHVQPSVPSTCCCVIATGSAPFPFLFG